MKENTKNFAQYLLAGIVAFFGGRAKAENSQDTQPEPAPITAQNTFTTNRPAFAEVQLPQQSAPTNTPTTVTVDSVATFEKGRHLYDMARELLCLNEGCRTNFYRCSAKKITIGAGCNIQDFCSILQTLNLPIICPKEEGGLEALRGERRDQLCQRLPDMTDEEVAKVTMLPQHVEQLSRETYAYFYERMAQRFAKPAPEYVSINGQTTKTTNMLSGIDFNDVPSYVRVPIMDTAYQLGETKFEKYHLFETALRKKDYITALQELAVNQTDRATQHFKNAGLARRAFRKDFFGMAYLISKNYPQFTDKAFVIGLANLAHSRVTKKAYNGVIDQVEKDAAFKCLMPFIMEQFHANLSPEDAATKQAELTTQWQQTNQHLNQPVVQQNKAAQQGVSK